MCGISGLLSPRDGAPSSIREALVGRMNDAIAHRGPDAEGRWSNGFCTLGHRRLSIIDLSVEGNQPMTNEDGSVAAVVNGEIYNFVALREALVAKGHVFRSRSDSEVVVHLYEEHGEGCIAKLDGMFAIALYDARARRLLLARDRSGKKPLYYRTTRAGLAFASELHALVTSFPDERPSVCAEAIDEYLTLQYVPSPRTAFEGIFKLPAASLAVVDDSLTVRPTRYWSRPSGPIRTESIDALAEELRALLSAAVRRRMVADVPLGAFLSGGVDSTSIVALMREAAGEVKTFSIGFPHADDSELEYAAASAKHYGTEHHAKVVAPAMTTVLGEIVAHHGEPFADSSALATWYLARETRAHVKVALSGDASDELFGGYKRYNPARVGHLHDALPTGVRALFRGGLRAAGALHPNIARYAARVHRGEAERYASLAGQFLRDEKASFYARGRATVADETVARFERVLRESHGPTALARLLALDAETYLVDDINVKVDIASMAHALEVRCPFLDTSVVEFAARLPDHARMRLRGKFILRKAMASLVPREVLERRKRGFGLPLARWLREDLREMSRDVLLGPRAKARGVLDPAAVARLFTEFDRGRDHADRIWTLLMLELWYQRFIDGA